jgi:hypothetical protein
MLRKKLYEIKMKELFYDLLNHIVDDEEVLLYYVIDYLQNKNMMMMKLFHYRMIMTKDELENHRNMLETI